MAICANVVRMPIGLTSKFYQKILPEDFLDGPVGENSPANAEDMGSIPSLGRFHTPQGS